jgi:threonine/homoserine/homoserine lactone efflux protein
MKSDTHSASQGGIYLTILGVAGIAFGAWVAYLGFATIVAGHWHSASGARATDSIFGVVLIIAGARVFWLGHKARCRPPFAK